jgi:NAD(P)H-dependent FMN reductase/predicted ester cyclase
MTRIGIILGSTRPNRLGEQVATWVHDAASLRDDAEFTVIDLRDHPLPHLDEPLSPALGRYQHAHTRAWADTIASFDGYVMVTPEYNHSTPGVLKNAIDFVHAEWSNKAVGLVSYGGAGGTAAAGQLRQICGQLGMADVSTQVVLMLHTDFENFRAFTPGERAAATVEAMLDQVVAWSNALAPLRAQDTNKAAFRRFVDVTNTHDAELISKTVDEVVEPDVVMRTPLPIGATGASAFKEVFATLHQAFPDLHVSVEDLIAEGDKVVARNTVTGTHQGEYLGRPPTGNRITYDEVFILRFAGGRVVETWGIVDVLAQLRQLDAVTSRP